MTIVPNISVYTGTVPDRTSQSPNTFSESVGTYLDYFDQRFTPDTNDVIYSMNGLSIDMNNLSLIMQGYTNYKGDYSSTTIYDVSDAMTFTDDKNYVCKVGGTVDMPPDTYPAKWREVKEGILNVRDDPSPELGANLNALGRTIYNSTIGTTTGLTLAVSVSNILKATLVADSPISFTNISSGSTDWLVEIESAGFTVTWDTAVEWDGDGTEPEWGTGVDTAYFYTTDGGTTIKGMRVRTVE